MANIWSYKNIYIFIIEVVKFLLENGASFIFTERFNQDRLEEYFEKHRSLGQRMITLMFISLAAIFTQF